MALTQISASGQEGVTCDERSLQVPKASPRQLESYATPDRATRTR